MNKPTLFAYLDLMTGVFAFFLMIAAILMAVNAAKQGDIKSKAEFIVTMTWENGSPDDVDLWVRDPLGNIVMFQQKDMGLMTLDRDDLGGKQNTIQTTDGSVIIDQYRREMVSIRGLVPGEYVAAAMLYNQSSDGPVKVMVEVIKLNPYIVVGQIELTFTSTKELQTALSFTIDSDGHILSVDKTTQKVLIPPK